MTHVYKQDRTIEKFLFQQNKWNNSHFSQSDSYTFTFQMGENRRRKSNHQKANTSARQINWQNKFASLNSEDSSSNSGNFSHYQEQPHRKEQNTHRTDHRKPDKVDYSAISEASEALQSLIQSCPSSMKKSFKQNNQSLRSQKQTEHNEKNKQNNQSNTEQSKPKGSQQYQSKKNQIKIVCVWSVFNKNIQILELLQIQIIVNQKYYISCISTNFQIYSPHSASGMSSFQIYIKFQTQNKKQLQLRDSFIQKKQLLIDTTTITLSTWNTLNSNDYKHKLKFHFFFKFTTIPICQRRVRLLLYGRFISHIALIQTFNKILCIISIIITDLAFIIQGMKIVLGHNKILCC
ncbi:Hypothetical_protein [Hexamita inflata]|uniref:Hypothetical_protein n=1 Tax=Hexamita inflata TaxID=28002 RepID=A0AA86NLT2_9EUKA|nr:Hypothetical protein HINF_LOCUS8856 [Hexamita inflata]